MTFDPANNLSVTRGVGLEQAVVDFEQWFIWWTLERNDFNQSKCAGELKIHRNSLVSRIREWGWAEKVQDGYAGKKVEIKFGTYKVSGDDSREVESSEKGLDGWSGPKV